jgi:hypothetical protein
MKQLELQLLRQSDGALEIRIASVKEIPNAGECDCPPGTINCV